MKWAAIIVGVLLIVLAILYFITPANSLPAFLPGHDPASSAHHMKHGIASLLLGLACFAYVWFQGGKKSPQKEEKSAE